MSKVFHCSKCGRFSSEASGGFADEYVDEYNGYATELGYPLCAKCWKKNRRGDIE